MRRAAVWKWRRQGETDYRPEHPWRVNIMRPNGMPHRDYPRSGYFRTHTEALAWAIEQVGLTEKNTEKETSR